MSKTPVSILQEYCNKNCIIPQYDLIVNGVGTHDPIFKYKVIVKDIITYGEGKSKKEAKHEAAKAALSSLPESEKKNKKPSFDKPILEECVDDITSPYYGALKQNAIGELINICTFNKLTSPAYVMIGEEGPPHAKTFTYQCRVAKLIEIGASRTKQQAKHLSAKAMLNRLIEIFGDKLETTPPETEEKTEIKENEMDELAKSTYGDIKQIKFIENFDLLISNYHRINLLEILGDDPQLIDKLSKYGVEDFSPNTEDSILFLHDLFKDSIVKFAFMELACVDDKFAVMCILDSYPSFVESSIEENVQNAKNTAAHNMIVLLKTFL